MCSVRTGMCMYAKVTDRFLPNFVYRFVWVAGSSCRNLFFEENNSFDFQPTRFWTRKSSISVYAPECLLICAIFIDQLISTFACTFFVRPNPWGRIKAHRFRLWFSSTYLNFFWGRFRPIGPRITQWKKSLSSSSSPFFSVLICLHIMLGPKKWRGQQWRFTTAVHRSHDEY